MNTEGPGTPEGPPERHDEEDFDAYAVIRGFAPPVAAFVFGGVLLLALPAAPGPTTASLEMLALAGVVYTMAMLGKARAQKAAAATRLWTRIATAWSIVSVLFVIALRLVI